MACLKMAVISIFFFFYAKKKWNDKNITMWNGLLVAMDQQRVIGRICSFAELGEVRLMAENGPIQLLARGLNVAL